MRVGITGGIGSGKSTVCRLFGVLGVPVYNSDAEARRLMNESGGLKALIEELLGEKAYYNGGLDRKYVSSRVFSQPELLNELNNIVHPAVGEDFIRWCETHETAKYVILESAILFESGFNRYVDRTVTVSAPEAERIARTVFRDGANIEDVRARMANQIGDIQREALSDYVIRNDENVMITDQVLWLNDIFSNFSE